MRSVHDPEIPVNIYDLGLIYTLDVDGDGRVAIEMTLTAPNCPVADKIPADVAAAVRGVEGVQEVDVKLVWEPAWSTDRMTDVGRFELQAMGIDPDRAKDNLSGSRPTGLTVGRKPSR
jgi:FeS assembly SUF system protein